MEQNIKTYQDTVTDIRTAIFQCQLKKVKVIYQG